MAAELLKRLFYSQIQAELFPDGTFLSFAMNDNAFVNNNSVELPHSGSIPDVAVDRSSLPATIAKRTDAATQYALLEFTTDPTLLQDSEGLIVAYNKRASIIDQHVKKINTKGQDQALYAWASSGASNVGTSGTGRATSSASATGLRKALTKDDVIGAINILNQQDVPAENRKIIVPSDMYGDILGIDEFVRADAFGTSNIPTGLVGRVFGLDVFMRSRTTVFTDTTIKAEGATGLAADNQGAVVWHPDFVRRAVGANNVYINTGVAEYYGDIMSVMARFGALRARNDNKGVVTIVETASP